MKIECENINLFHCIESGFDTYTVEIPVKSLYDWCMMLCLLLFDCIDSLQIGPSPDGYKLIVTRCLNAHKDRGVYKYGDNAIYLQLPEVQIKLWIWFPLQHIYTDYLKDQCGYTDHIDVELDSEEESRNIVDLTMVIV